jgi:uncharacterized protein DUF5681
MAPFDAKGRRKRRTASRGTLRPVSEDYRVGPGCPPRQHQFKPGTSGNPKGARQRQPSIAPDLKALLQAALGKKTTLRLGDRERILTKAAAGIEQLVDQFARGDRYARRDLFDLAEKLGLDLGASSKAAIEELAGKALTAEDQAIVTDFLNKHSRQLKDSTNDAQAASDTTQETES